MHAVQRLEALAHHGGQRAVLDAVEDRLVVFVDQHHHRRAVLRVRALDQLGEPAAHAAVPADDAQAALVVVQDLEDALLQPLGAGQPAPAEADAHDRMALRPVPARFSRQPGKQRPVALEQLLERVHQQTLAEAARPAQEEGLAGLDQVDRHARLVHVVVAALAHLAQVLDADRQLAPRRDGAGGVHEAQV